MRTIVIVAALAAMGSACGLNPQPFPPSSSNTNSPTGGANGTGSSTTAAMDGGAGLGLPPGQDAGQSASGSGGTAGKGSSLTDASGSGADATSDVAQRLADGAVDGPAGDATDDRGDAQTAEDSHPTASADAVP
jgi:hypothetical protein